MTRVSRDLRRFRTVLELLVKMGMGMLVSWILQIFFCVNFLFSDGGSLLLKSFFSFHLFQWNVILVHYYSTWLKSVPGCDIYKIQFITCRHFFCGWRGDRTGQCHSPNQRTVNEWSRPRQRSRPRESRWQRRSSTGCRHRRRSGAAEADLRLRTCRPTCRSGTAHNERHQLSAASFLVRQPAGVPFFFSSVCSLSRSKFFLSCPRITWIYLLFFGKMFTTCMHFLSHFWFFFFFFVPISSVDPNFDVGGCKSKPECMKFWIVLQQCEDLKCHFSILVVQGVDQRCLLLVCISLSAFLRFEALWKTWIRPAIFPFRKNVCCWCALFVIFFFLVNCFLSVMILILIDVQLAARD